MISKRRRATGRSTPMARGWSALAVGLLAWFQAGCSLDSLLKTDDVSPGTTDPRVTQTRDGALAAYYGEVAQLRQALGWPFSFIPAAGLLSDELRNVSSNAFPLDLRQLSEVTGGPDGGTPFFELNKLRGQGAQAIGLLTRFAPEDTALVGHTYALQAYAEVMLAELYCSGIPLSTLDYEGDYTLRPGSTTAEVLAHATTLFDTAMTFAGDSTRFLHLAAVGKGRALLGLGRFADAATAVAGVPDGYRYDVGYSTAVVGASGADAANFARFIKTTDDGGVAVGYGVADHEGSNGLDYVSSGDPRTVSLLLGSYQDGGFPVYRPVKYASDGSSSITLAGGVEARLIEVEAALQASPADGQWLVKLNALRTDGTFDTRPTADPDDDPAAVDTLWHAGSGAVDSLAPLKDPGASLAGPAATAARVDLLFRERAFWLFLTGHRQGDLRRLIRQYERNETTVYPTGSYPGGANNVQYGRDVTVPIPEGERNANPLYTGCISRGA